MKRTAFAPSRGRELKSDDLPIICKGFVRPLAGAGIEIGSLGFMASARRVRPLAGAGIEIRWPSMQRNPGTVRPLAGAGIEISFQAQPFQPPSVRPLAGAGIEILILSPGLRVRFCSPPRGGGN